MILNSVFGKVSNEYRGTPEKIRGNDGEKLYTFEYKCETKHKKYTVKGAISTEHADKRVKKIYNALKEKINEGGHVKPIDLQRAMERALNHTSDLKQKTITIVKR